MFGVDSIIVLGCCFRIQMHLFFVLQQPEPAASSHEWCNTSAGFDAFNLASRNAPSLRAWATVQSMSSRAKAKSSVVEEAGASRPLQKNVFGCWCCLGPRTFARENATVKPDTQNVGSWSGERADGDLLRRGTRQSSRSPIISLVGGCVQYSIRHDFPVSD